MVSWNLQFNIFLQVYCSGNTGQTIEHFLMLHVIHFCMHSNKAIEKIEGLFETQFACEI